MQRIFLFVCVELTLVANNKKISRHPETVQGIFRAGGGARRESLARCVAYISSNVPLRPEIVAVPLEVLVKKTFLARPVDLSDIRGWLLQGNEALKEGWPRSSTADWPSAEAHAAFPNVIPPRDWNSEAAAARTRDLFARCQVGCCI